MKESFQFNTTMNNECMPLKTMFLPTMCVCVGGSEKLSFKCILLLMIKNFVGLGQWLFRFMQSHEMPSIDTLRVGNHLGAYFLNREELLILFRKYICSFRVSGSAHLKFQE